MLYNKLIRAPVTVLQSDQQIQSGLATGEFDPQRGFELTVEGRVILIEPKTFSMLSLTANNGETMDLGPNFKRLKNLGSAIATSNPGYPLLYAAQVICKALKHTLHSWTETNGKKKHMCSSCGYYFED